MIQWISIILSLLVLQACGSGGLFKSGSRSKKTINKGDSGVLESSTGTDPAEPPGEEGGEEKVDDSEFTTEQRLLDPKIGAEVARPDSPSTTVTKNITRGDTRTVNVNMDVSVWGVGKSSTVSTDFNVDYSSSFSIYMHTPKDSMGVLSADGKVIYDPENRPVADCTYDGTVTSGANSIGSISASPRIPFVGSSAGTTIDFGKTLSDVGTVTISSNTFTIREGENIDEISLLCTEGFEKVYKQSIDDQLKFIVKNNLVMDQRESFNQVVLLAKTGTSDLIEDVHGLDFTVDKASGVFKGGTKVVTGGLGGVRDATGGVVKSGAGAVVKGVKGVFLTAPEDPGLRFCFKYQLNYTNEILTEDYNDCKGKPVALESDVGKRAKEVAQEIGMSFAQGVRSPAP